MLEVVWDSCVSIANDEDEKIVFGNSIPIRIMTPKTIVVVDYTSECSFQQLCVLIEHANANSHRWRPVSQLSSCLNLYQM